MNATSYSDTSSLTVGTTYYYRVRAYNTSGNSAYSNEASATATASSGFSCADSTIGTLSTAFSNDGTTTSVMWLGGGTNTRYDFRGTTANSTYNATNKNYTPSFNIRFSAAHSGGCAFGGVITNGYATSLGRGGSGIRNYPANDGGQFLVRDENVANFSIEGWRMHHNWDPIRLGGVPGVTISNVTVEQCWISDTYDDAIENDTYRDGVVVDDCLVERCFIFVSNRTTQTSTNYSNRILTVNRCLVGLDEMYPNAKTDPNSDTDESVGQFFKLHGMSISFDIYDTIFYVPRVGDLGNGDPFKDLIANNRLRNSSGNTIVWAGGGPYPFTVPANFTVTTNTSVWTNAVSVWKTNHPHIPRIPGVD